MRTFKIATMICCLTMLAGLLACDGPDNGFDEATDYGYGVNVPAPDQERVEPAEAEPVALDEEPEDESKQWVGYLESNRYKPDEILIMHDREQRRPYTIGVINQGDFSGTILYYRYGKGGVSRLTKRLADDAYVHGILNAHYLIRLRYGESWQMYYGNHDEHPQAASDSQMGYDQRLVFKVLPEGVVVIGDRVLNDEHPTPVFSYLFGNKMTYRAPVEQSWLIYYDEETSWTRGCLELRVERLMDSFGDISGYLIDCDGDFEQLRPHRELLGIM